jgi:predicted peptidase
MTATTRLGIGTLSLALLLGSVNAAAAQRAERDDASAVTDPRVQHRSYTMEETGETIPYALFVPSTYDASEPSRLMVTLHGAGRQYDWVMGYEGFLDRAERDGYIVVTPLGYTRNGGYGARGDDPDDDLSEKDVMNVLAMVRDEFNIDDNRIYLWGHSMGGTGTYYIASQYPDIWAGLGAAAGGTITSRYVDEDAIRHIPFLVLHGSGDGTVPVDRSRQSVARMKELGMQHLYVEIEGGDHSRFINSSEEVVGMLFDFFNIVAKAH